MMAKKRKEYVLDNLLTIQRQMDVNNAEFSEKIGLSGGTFKNLIDGSNNPSLDTLLIISENLGVSMDSLCSEKMES